ncbi:unnamed protein product [Microthlaspi erraticum]|uniref:Uncharacterized protein n=1 Tax=Microthlaspi erraticum TaxID=1685480 RepID=A0A6D2HLI3_9BRAS|nr:unnamed protein product [Microthlaspi erraticum]
MMRYLGLGKTLAEACGKGGLQYRHFSSASEKVGTKIGEYGIRGAFCAAGYVIGGITSSPVAKQTQEDGETAVKILQRLDEREAVLKAFLEKQE